MCSRADSCALAGISKVKYPTVSHLGKTYVVASPGRMFEVRVKRGLNDGHGEHVLVSQGRVSCVLCG